MRNVLIALTGAMVLGLGGCGGADDSEFGLVVIGSADDPFATGMRLPLAGQLVRAATTEGLVSFDEQGRVIPALADRWIVTDDGQSYIFRLRDGAWRNGDEITSETAKAALEATLTELRKTPLGLDLAGVDEIRVMAGRVIELRLKRPMPYLLQLLAQPELGLVHEKQGGGPMAMERQGSAARLTPIDPARLGMPEVSKWDERTRQLRMTALEGPEAVAQFNSGDIDMVLGGQIQDFPLTRTVGILRGTIQLDPVSGLFGLRVVRDRGFLAVSENREALAMAIDREALIAPFGVGGWRPTTRIVAPDLAGDTGTIGERWTEQPLEERRSVAAARVRSWRLSQSPAGDAKKNSSRAIVSIWLPHGEGSAILFRQLARDFAAVGILARRAEATENADLRLVDDVARYPHATWYLNRLSCQAKRGLCLAAVDARVKQAGSSPDAAERAALLTEAEVELTNANLYIPFGPPIRWSLVRGSVNGFEPNMWGWHPLMPLAWVPR